MFESLDRLRRVRGGWPFTFVLILAIECFMLGAASTLLEVHILMEPPRPALAAAIPWTALVLSAPFLIAGLIVEFLRIPFSAWDVSIVLVIGALNALLTWAVRSLPRRRLPPGKRERLPASP